MHSEMNLGGGGTDLSISFHNNPLLKIFENKTLHLVMIIVLSLGILLRPLPEQLQSFMKTPVARIVGVCLIVLFGNKSPIVSVLLGVFLVLSFMEEGINNSQKEIKENFAEHAAPLQKKAAAPTKYKLVKVSEEDNAESKGNQTIEIGKEAILATPLNQVKTSSCSQQQAPQVSNQQAYQSPCSLNQQPPANDGYGGFGGPNNKVPGAQNDCLRSDQGQFCTQGAGVGGVSGYSSTGLTFC